MYPDGVSKAIIHPRGFYPKPIHVNQALTIYGGATPSNTSTTKAIVKGCDKLEVGASHDGASTELEVNIYPITSDGTVLPTAKYSFTLNDIRTADSVSLSPGLYGVALELVNKDVEHPVTSANSWVEATWR